jgi:hypothetical protein
MKFMLCNNFLMSIFVILPYVQGVCITFDCLFTMPGGEVLILFWKNLEALCLLCCFLCLKFFDIFL